MDSPDPFSNSSGYLNLLNSQHDYAFPPSMVLGSSPPVPVFTSQWTDDPSHAEPTGDERKGRRNWSPKEDVVLISAWLNTSKDPVVGNEQKAEAFWKRIAAYFAASPKMAGMQKREPGHCKQRWCKINDQVCKYVGCLASATTQKSSGQSENDVMKLANEIYLNDYGAKFTLEHCWRELRHDQKWCASTSHPDSAKSKRRKCDGGSEASGQSATSYTVNNEDGALGIQQSRPPGVKASKGKGKRPGKGVEDVGNNLKEFECMWEIKKKDFELKEKDFQLKDNLSKHKMLENLLGKTEPLSELELALKNKLITDMLNG